MDTLGITTKNNMGKVLKIILKVINLIFFFGCLTHIGMNGYYIFYPELPSIRVYKTHLQTIEFPLVFKVCAQDRKNGSVDRYIKFGYNNAYNFFLGKSMFNESLYGWNGHTKNGSTIANVKGNSSFTTFKQHFLCKSIHD